MKTRKSLPEYDAPETVMRIAGAWLARKDRGFTSAESDEFNCWIDANPSHAAAVAQLERTMSTFDRLRELAPYAGAKPDRDAFAPARASRRWLHIAGFGIAASIAIVFWSGRPDLMPAAVRYTTSAAGYDRATLIDGTTVELNSDTTIEVEFTARERRVRLTRGEAHFQVAEDSSRPFVVQAKTVSVSAVGTAFNVRLAHAGVEVLVTEGRVQVQRPAPASPARSTGGASTEARFEIPLLTAGHKVMVSTVVDAESTNVATVSLEEIQRALAWQARVTEFSQTPLSAIVAEFNRQNRQQIVIHDPDLGALRIGGNFRMHQPDGFVRLLETSFGIAVERSGDLITLRKAPAGPQ